jgi:MSHA biogenesis protein MshJ
MSQDIRQRWQGLLQRYNAFSRREKMLVAAVLVLGPFLIGEALIVDPLLAKGRGLNKSIEQQSASLAEMQAQVGVLQQKLATDPDAAAKNELAALQEEQAKLDTELRQRGTTLVRPEDMNGLLERLLARHPGLRLVSLKTMAPKGILADKESAAEKPGEAKRLEKRFDLYRHGVEIRVEGTYGELQAYLLRLEQLPQRLLWEQLQFKVIEYPKAEMSLTVYTLSPERDWLAL